MAQQSQNNYLLGCSEALQLLILILLFLGLHSAKIHMTYYADTYVTCIFVCFSLFHFMDFTCVL